MTATETPVETLEEPLVAARDTKVLFMARRSELRLVKTPILPRFGVAGQKVGDVPGQTVCFRDSTYRCPVDGEIRYEDGRPGDAAEVLEWLKGHHLLGDVNEGFWIVDPTAPAPTEAEMSALLVAATDGDKDRLRAAIEQETVGWGRPAILKAAQAALDRIVLLEELAAKQAPPASETPPVVEPVAETPADTQPE